MKRMLNNVFQYEGILWFEVLPCYEGIAEWFFATRHFFHSS